VPDSVLYAMPFSLRQPVEKLSDIQITNEISGTVLELPIRKEIQDAIRDFKKSASECFARLEPFTFRKCLMIAASLPYTLASFGVYFLSRKVTLLFTNLNASKVPYKWANKVAKSAFILAHAAGDCNCIIILLTMGDKMSLSCIGDENILSHP
jgi:hypothetical protein